MTQEEFENIWHALNEANVDVVCASKSQIENQQLRFLLSALENTQNAEKLLLETLADI